MVQLVVVIDPEVTCLSVYLVFIYVMASQPLHLRFAAGAGGGVCQTVVMGPCTFLVTAVVTGSKDTNVWQKTVETWNAKGIKVRGEADTTWRDH